MATGIYTVIEFRQVHIGSTKTDPVILTRVVHIAAAVANQAARRWRTWATPRADFEGLTAAYLCIAESVEVADCNGAKSETLTLEEFERWTRTAVTPSWDGNEKHAAAWRKLQ